MAKKFNPKCPNCGNEMKLVIYGLPLYPPSGNDNWVIGGCSVHGITDEPEYICVNCDEEDNIQDLIDLK